MLSSTEEKIEFKQLLKTICIQKIEERIAAAQYAMQSAQDSANSEAKSTAGDKHETARAMSQLENEMNSKQLAEAVREMEFMKSIYVDNVCSVVTNGAVLITEDRIFFVAAGLGTTIIDGKTIILISAHAPITKVLRNKKKGETISFNGKIISILEVF